MKELLLTISFLASNRKDTTGKCLASLKGLLENVPSELIVVDTGCDEEMLGIIREYTDHIIPFEWCNNFAKARNTGLNKAKGKWFLFIDDDEWFEDTTEIEDFFLSGEYKKYHSATYVVRNYFDMTGKRWSDNLVGRMTQIFPDTRFEYKIHEVLKPKRGPEKEFSAYVHHYGYAFKTEEEKYKHSKRNLDLLKVEHQKEPNELHHHAQMAQEYQAISEYENCIEICMDGISRYEDAKGNGKGLTSRSYNMLVAFLVQSKALQFRHQEVLEYVELYWDKPSVHFTSKAYLDYKAVLAACELRKYGSAIGYAERYIHAYTLYEKETDKYQGLDGLILDRTFVQSNYQMVIGCSIICFAHLGKLDMALGYCNMIEWENSKLFLPAVMSKEILYAMKEKDYPKEFSYICNCLIKRNDVRKIFIKELDRQYSLADEHKKKVLLSNLQHMEDCHSVIKCMRIIYADIMGNTEMVEAISEELIREEKQFLQYVNKYQLWKIFQKYDLELWNTMEALSFDIWKDAIDGWCRITGAEDIVNFKKCVPQLRESQSIYAHYAVARMAEREFLLSYQEYDYAKFKEYLKNLIVKEEHYYRMIYQNFVFKVIPGLLPVEYRFFNNLYDAVQMVEEGAKSDAIRFLKQLHSDYIEGGEIIKRYLLLLRETEVKENQDEVFNEQANLIVQIKQNIPVLVEAGKVEDAKNVINQLMHMVPDDEQLIEWREMLE